LPRHVRSDPGKLRQILVNLLGNAAKFTRAGGVTLRAALSDASGASRLRFEVEDSGVGIAPDEMDKVFAPFAQTESGIAARTGTGLGVAISRDYARLLGGELSVKSRVGVGTTFTVELAIELGPPAEPAAAVDSAPVVGFEGDQPRPKILLVDDEEDNRTVLRELLTATGIQTFEAANGSRAVELFSEVLPDFVFMDIKMPGMDGVEATRQIRLLPGGGVPIVVLSASVFDDQRSTVLSTGATEFIAKPFREAEIWSALERLLGLRLVRRSVGHRVEPQAVALTREEVRALGPDTVGALREAVLLGYVQRVPSLLAAFATTHPATVAGLTKLARTLEIEKLLALLDG
jgi:CheY-like chemotaxis protein